MSFLLGCASGQVSTPETEALETEAESKPQVTRTVSDNLTEVTETITPSNTQATKTEAGEQPAATETAPADQPESIDTQQAAPDALADAGKPPVAAEGLPTRHTGKPVPMRLVPRPHLPGQPYQLVPVPADGRPE